MDSRGCLLLLCCPQEEYIREQIEWREIAFTDNQPCIELISQRPHGILKILNDQSSFPQVMWPPLAGCKAELGN